MFKVSLVSENRLNIEFDGKLDTEQMREALDQLEEKSKGIESGRMLYSIGKFEIPSLGALGVEFSRLPSLFSLVRRFDKAAVIADQTWVRKISALEGALIPGLEIKAFTPEEIEVAEAWLAV